MRGLLLTKSFSESYRGRNSGKCSTQVHQDDKGTIELDWLEPQKGDGSIWSGDGRKVKTEETANPQPAKEKRERERQVYPRKIYNKALSISQINSFIIWQSG